VGRWYSKKVLNNSTSSRDEMDAYFQTVAKPFQHFLEGKKPTIEDKATVCKSINHVVSEPITADSNLLNQFFQVAMLYEMWIERNVTDQDVHIYV